MIPRLPPSAAMLLGIIVGCIGGAIAAYYIVTSRMDAELAAAERDTVIEGTKKAKIIQKETDKEIEDSRNYSDKVKHGKIKIVTGSGANKRFSDEFYDRLQSKVSRAQSISD